MEFHGADCSARWRKLPARCGSEELRARRQKSSCALEKQGAASGEAGRKRREREESRARREQRDGRAGRGAGAGEERGTAGGKKLHGEETQGDGRAAMGERQRASWSELERRRPDARLGKKQLRCWGPEAAERCEKKPSAEGAVRA
jgi:hypothetical protein